MLDAGGRRRLLYAAVTVLEPYACGRLVQHYVVRRHRLIIPLLRIYVDLEQMVRAGHLTRRIKPRLGGDGAIFFWETLGLTLVEPERPTPGRLAATASVIGSIPDWTEAVAGNSGYYVALLGPRRVSGELFVARKQF